MSVRCRLDLARLVSHILNNLCVVLMPYSQSHSRGRLLDNAMSIVSAASLTEE